MEQHLKWGIKAFCMNSKKEGSSWRGFEQGVQQQAKVTPPYWSPIKGHTDQKIVSCWIRMWKYDWLVTCCTSTDPLCYHLQLEQIFPSGAAQALSACFYSVALHQKLDFIFLLNLCYIQAANVFIKKNNNKKTPFDPHLLSLQPLLVFFFFFGPHYQCWKEHLIINTAKDASPSTFSIGAVMYAGPNSVAMLLKPIKVFGTSVWGGNVHSLYHISYGYWLKCKRVYDFWLW